MRSTFTRVAAASAVCGLALTGCLGQSGGGGGGGGGGGNTDGEPAAGDKAVSILGAFSDAEEQAFNDSLAPFEKESGIDVTYTPASDFTTEIRIKTSSGNPPDIALFPQPGLVLDLANGGDVVALDEAIDLSAAEETLIPGFLEAATGEDGKVYGAPMRMAVKSIVWYPVPEFEEAGYTVPETWTELMDLTEKIKADGNTPWCIGAESGADTGWVMTDWIEELVLRSAGPDVYDQWVSHEIPFNDPAIQEAGDLFGKIVFTDGYVRGGPRGILTTPFGTAANPMVNGKPDCFLHRQGNFITSFFPDDVQADLANNVGTFVLPPVEGGFDGQPILGGGDIAAMLNNDEDVVKVMEFITSAEFGGPWAEAGGWLSPHKTFDNSQYPDEITRKIAELAQGADVFRFDGSDLMPASVGAGTFWDEMVSWVAGQKDLAAALTAIDESWPSS
jgi:alpha-glucoside transport system substrate-binding protein